MSGESMHDLFDRWERVWHEGQHDLIPSCVGSHYIRHDEKGDRTVTREAYAANWRFQPRLAIGYQDLLDRSLIEFRAFCQRQRKALNVRAVQF